MVWVGLPLVGSEWTEVPGTTASPLTIPEIFSIAHLTFQVISGGMNHNNEITPN